MAAKNSYSNSIVSIPITIANGDSTSEFVDGTGLNLPNVAGFSQLSAIVLPDNFPAAEITFDVKQTADDDPAKLYISDGGAGSGILTIVFDNEGFRTQVPVQPWWFIGAGLIQIVSSVNMTSDTTIQLVFLPIIQSVA